MEIGDSNDSMLLNKLRRRREKREEIAKEIITRFSWLFHLSRPCWFLTVVSKITLKLIQWKFECESWCGGAKLLYYRHQGSDYSWKCSFAVNLTIWFKRWWVFFNKFKYFPTYSIKLVLISMIWHITSM